MKRKILAIPVFGLVLMALASWPMAQERSSLSFPIGTYQPFGFWQQVQLGATSLMNPTIAGSAAVVNSYPLEALTQQVDVENVAISKLQNGDAIFARKTADGHYVPLTPSETGKLVGQLKNGESVEGIAVLTYQRIPPAKSEKLIVWPMGN